MNKIILMILTCISFNAFSWDGYDYTKSQYVEITEGNPVREGEEIEVYNYDTASYNYVEVQNIYVNSSSVEVEVYDNTTGETRTLEMEME